MPRPPRRAAPKRAAATATASVPVTAAALDIEPRATTPSSDIYNVSDREKNAASQRRRSARISTAATDTIAARDHDTALDKPNETLDTSRREEAATPLQGRLADLTGLDMDDSMFNDLNTTYNTIEPASAGPASGSRLRDSSTITASHFKRRPRAGSFLSRDDGPIRPSSRAGPNTPGFSSTFNIGNFKRRAREPSILGTAQKPRARQASRDIESDLDRGLGDDDDDEDSAPEAESTPFKQTKRQSGQGVAKEPTTEPKESRKRKSTEGHTQRDRPSPSITQDRAADQLENSDSELSELEDEEPSLPPMPLATRARQETPNRPSTPGVPSTPIMDEELMAPPLSTDSSEGGDNAWPPVRGQAKGRSRRPALRRTPTRDDSMSDMSSPPSLTHSPNYAEGSSPAQTRQQSGRAAKRKVPPTTARQEIRLPTTAALTGLLPRRRQRNTRAADDSDDEQVDLSGLGADDDELTHLDVRARRRPARGAAARNQLSNAAASNRRKQNNHGPATRKSTRTYGRLSDKENEEAAAGEEENAENAAGQTAEEEIPADDAVREDSQMMVERMGEELKQAARKFQEVDKWSLEYEEAVPASSPNGAR